MVVGSPKGSVWKHDAAFDMDVILQIPIWFAGMFLAALGCVLGMAFLVLRRWFRQDQQARDAARSNWINGVFHDIRTPLSMVMGYAAQMELDPGLSPERWKQAAVIRHQSQAIRGLVNDLNLTMRLDSEMQALRKESIQLRYSCGRQRRIFSTAVWRRASRWMWSCRRLPCLLWRRTDFC